MAPLAELKDKALSLAFAELGTRETGPNRGPRVERYLASVGLDPGHPWCMAFVVFCFDSGAQLLKIDYPLPRTGKVTRFYRKALRWQSPEPTVGAIYCHATHPEDEESAGHTGIVLRIDREQGLIVGIEGNSNVHGSREGDGVVINYRPLTYVNLGYVDIARPPPRLAMRPV